MSEPLIFIPTLTVNDGEVERIKELSERFAERVAASETDPLAFHFFLSEDGSEVSNVQVHADAASMEAYLAGAGELIGEALTLSEPKSIDVFGTPGPMLQQVLQHNADQGIRVRVKPTRIGTNGA